MNDWESNTIGLFLVVGRDAQDVMADPVGVTQTIDHYS